MISPAGGRSPLDAPHLRARLCAALAISLAALAIAPQVASAAPLLAAKADFPTGTLPRAVTSADFNADGNRDLAVANEGSNSVSVLLGNGNGTFAAKADFTTGAAPYSVTSADFNADGKPDLAIANGSSRTISVLLSTTASNAAAPSFAAKVDFTTGSIPKEVTSADFNADGKPDLAVANNSSNTVSVLLNTTAANAATPSFAAKTDFTTGTGPISVTSADFNADGKPDLAVANNSSNTVSVLLSTTASNAAAPSFAAKVDFTTGSSPYSVTSADINADGKPDLAVANWDVPGTVSVLLNTTAANAPTPSFAAKADFTTGSRAISVTSADFNADGRPDLAVANSGSSTVSVLLNTTATGAAIPSFAAKADFTTGASPISVASADFNNDGKPDLAVANQSSNTVSVLLGNLNPSFAAKADFPTGSVPSSVTSADFNADGRPDLAVANSSSNTVSVLLGNGSGGFGAKTDFTTGTFPQSVTSADFNADGKPDLAVANFSSNSVSVLLGNGSGGFGAKTDFTTGANPRSVTSADFNADGKPDLAVANGSSDSVSVLLNTTATNAATPSFAARTDFTTGSNPISVTSADFNADGKPDLAVANLSSNTVSVLLGNGSGGFGAKTDLTTGAGPISVTSADFNADGKPDLAVANTSPSTVSVLLNTTTTNSATPSFGAKADFPTGASPQSVASADFNADGKPDLAVANNSSASVSVLLGNGSGGFGAKTDFTTGTFPYSVTSADFNADGKPDLAAANGSSTVSVLLGNGNPTAYPTEQSLPFGRHNGPVVRSVTIRNGGAVNLNIGTASISGTDAAAFRTSADNCSGQTLAVGGSCTISVRFDASSEGFKRASLVLPSNAPDAPLSIPLSGFRDDNPIAVNDTKILAEGDPAITIDVLANDTPGDLGTKTIASKTNGAHGTVAITSSGGDLTYTPNANYCGPDTFTYTLNGGSSATVSVTVSCVNDAPAGANNSSTINEDATKTFAPSDFGFSDPGDSPPDSLSSVTITTLPASGSLKLSGTPVSAGDPISAGDLTNLTFDPAANGCGASYASFTFQVQDDGGTTNGGVDTDQSPNTFTVNVNCVNDAPAGTDNTVTTNEDTPYTFAASDFGFSDPNDSPANNLSSVKVTTLPSAGTLKRNGKPVAAGDSISAANLTNLTFDPAANACGASYASFTFQVTDDGGTANGGVDTDQSPNTITIDVSCVNHAPTGADNTATINEDATKTFAASDFGFSDPGDSPPDSLSSVTITTLPANGTLRLSGTPVTAGDPISAGDLTNLTFDPAANGCGASYASFTFQVQDDGGTTNGGVDTDQSPNTITIDVTSVNDAPAGTTDTATINEDQTKTFAGSDFGLQDPNDSPANELSNVKITTLPAAGTLKLDGTAVNAGDFASAAQLAANKLTYDPAANANGSGYASFTFQVTDDGGTANGGVDTDQSPNTITIDVTSVNDAPAGTTDTATINEDQTKTFAGSDFGLQDPNDSPANELSNVKITTLPAAGTLKLDGTAVNAGDFASAAQLAANKLTYDPAANANGSGYASFTFQVTDDGGTANGGVDTDQSPNTITIDVTSVNDAPAGTTDTATINEDQTKTFAGSDFGLQDPNDSPANELSNVKITTLPAAGTLKLDGTAVNAGDFASAAQLAANKLTYDPAANANGSGYASFTFQVTDDGGTANGGVDTDQSPNTITIDVNSVNDAPTDIALTNSSVAENTPQGTDVGDLSSTDPDAGQTHTYTFATGTGDTDHNDFQITGTTLEVKNPLDFETGQTRSVRIRTTDSGSPAQSFDKVFTITVTDVNESPPDGDGDGVADADDNCPSASNSNQANTDSDAQGDACDSDDDNDGVADDSDACQTGAIGPGNDPDADGCKNSEDPDDDNDGRADASDACSPGEIGWTSSSSSDHDGDGCRDSSEDADDDNDGVTDSSDSCPASTVGLGDDSDGDGCKDSEDSDDDNDTVNDGSDNCPASPNAGQEDVDSDGIGDACDPTDDRPGTVPAPNAEPETTIGHFPKNAKRNHTHFRFRSSIAGSTFTCQIDKEEPEPCRSPKDYRVLDAGRHVFKVFATSPQGVDDPTPATARFRVKKQSR